MITKETNNSKEIDFLSGEVILVDKPLKLTSFQVVYQIRKHAGVKKVGHAGTLDPLATGLLIICTGKKTKEITKYQELFKTYKGTITLGKKSSSMDGETELVNVGSTENLSEENILKVRDKFLGKVAQIPPMYSAIKLNGKTLYKLARKGKSVHREAREIEIKRFDINIDLPNVDFEIECSKGTYIRVIANDFGEMLECGGYLSSLRRTAIGGYTVESALKIEEFIENYSVSRSYINN